MKLYYLKVTDTVSGMMYCEFPSFVFNANELKQIFFKRNYYRIQYFFQTFYPGQHLVGYNGYNAPGGRFLGGDYSF